MQLYLIRHCQSENNALWHTTGSAEGRSKDPALTKLGHQQAQHLAQFIAGKQAQDPISSDDNVLDRGGIQLTHVYCSLMRRAIETGFYIADALDLPLVARMDIHERGGIYLQDPQTNINQGLPGPNREHFEKKYPSLVLPDSLGEEGWWNQPYEPRDTALLRAQSMLEWLISAHDGTDDNVGLVIHGGFIQSIFSTLFHIPMLGDNFSNGRDLWIKANNGSITRIDFLDRVVRLNYQNRFEFIPQQLAT